MLTGNVVHQTLQQILELVSLYTARDPETSILFASRLIDNGLLHAGCQDFDQVLLQFIHAFISSGIQPQMF